MHTFCTEFVCGVDRAHKRLHITKFGDTSQQSANKLYIADRLNVTKSDSKVLRSIVVMLQSAGTRRVSALLQLQVRQLQNTGQLE